MSRKTKFLLIFTAFHALASMFTFVESFALGMARFDTGAERGATESVLSKASEILLFPVGTFILGLERADRFLPGLLGWIPLLANSVLWAFLGWWLYSAIRRWIRGRKASASV